MSWLTVRIDVDEARVDPLESVLTAFGAVAVEFADAEDQPILEPDPGTTPLWRRVRVTALFEPSMGQTEICLAVASVMEPGALPPISFGVIEDEDWVARLRDELVPINRRYPIEDLLDACANYLAVKHRRVSFEWAMIAGVNDRDSDARELAALCRQLSPHGHVNLIPLNPTPGYPTVGTSPRRVQEFRDLLENLGANATVRQNRGTDIDAACGQLAAGQPVTLSPKS